MLRNSGTLLFLFILIGCVALLLILIVILAIVGHKKPKGKGTTALKAVTLVWTFVTITASVMTALTYHNVTGFNLQYGYFSSVDGSNTELHVHRHSLSKSQNGSRIGHDVKYTLENNTLTFTLENGTTYSYEIKDFGTKLYENGNLVYKYSRND